MIKFHFLIHFSLKDRKRLRIFLQELFKKEGKRVEIINYVFCTDRYLLELNKKHLKHDTLTDIITFELSQNRLPLVADIYISIERIRENAKLYNTSFYMELHRVVFHGALHLCGYSDKTSAQIIKMRSMEESCLSRYFVSRELKNNGFHVKQ